MQYNLKNLANLSIPPVASALFSTLFIGFEREREKLKRPSIYSPRNWNYTLWRENACYLHKISNTDTDYGRLINPFFIEIQNFWAWADNLGR